MRAKLMVEMIPAIPVPKKIRRISIKLVLLVLEKMGVRREV
jgi:hypothetical protein